MLCQDLQLCNRSLIKQQKFMDKLILVFKIFICGEYQIWLHRVYDFLHWNSLHLTRVILINWSIHKNLLRKCFEQKIICFILPILSYLSEFERFLKPSKNRKLEVLCAITFGGIATHLKVVVLFKSQKFMLFTSKFEGRNHL